MIRRGEIWWADLPRPVLSGPGYRRPVVIVQADRINESIVRTVIVAVVTSQTKWAPAPGNVLLSRRACGLPRESVVNVSQLFTIDRTLLRERVGTLPRTTLSRIDEGLRIILEL